MSSEAVVPFRVEISGATIDDLRERLARTRWPEAETVDDWSQGVPLAYAQELCEHWRGAYDMQRPADRLNAHPQVRTVIDGLGIHAIHARSPHEDATPLLMTHGWPGSVVEFLDVLPLLTDPTAHGGTADDAFHVVLPSLPGYGFSDRPAERGWGPRRTGRAWAELMRRLGYDRYVAQGGDWGSIVTTELALHAPDRLVGIHLNYAALPHRALLSVGEPTAAEQRALDRLTQFRNEERGYSMEQGTRPQTLAYGLVDSPAAQCAWIVEKFMRWSDSGGHPERAFARDALLDNVMLYWLPGTGGSSARMYWESNVDGTPREQVTVPLAYSAFPEEIANLSERWLRLRYPNLCSFREVPRGGHFAAFEQPALFAEELRAARRAFPG